MTKELLKQCYDELAKLNGLVVKSEGVDCKFDDLLDELSREILKVEPTIEEYYNEWEEAIEDLTHSEIDLYKLKQSIFNEEQKIINETDFKEIYGKNNADVRKAHLDKILKEQYDEKQTLLLSIDYLKRRIDYIRSLMALQQTLIKVEHDE